MTVRKKILLIGHGGRESAIARALADDASVYAIANHVNPSIAQICQQTGGQLQTGSCVDGGFIKDFALRHCIDYAFVNADEPLSVGVVDDLALANIKTIGPTRQGSQIEWDKIFSGQLVHELFPRHTPRFTVVRSALEATSAIAEYRESDCPIVVKPQGLTGGKGVKVMGEHLKDYPQALKYIEQLLRLAPQEQVLITEKLEGIEFTIMGLTDGIRVCGAPVSYDYPYRYTDDNGPGTGGMGCFTDKNEPAFFLRETDLSICLEILQGTINRLNELGYVYSGVINGGFFLTKQGIYFMEFNARFGDPECINILSLLDSSFADILVAMHEKNLSFEHIRYAQQASVVKYLVSSSYPQSGAAVEFQHDQASFAERGIQTYFSSAVATEKPHGYRSVSSSRLVALATTDDSIELASQRINQAISELADPQLEYRADIASPENIQKIKAQADAIREHK